jgi:hypothetical protein
LDYADSGLSLEAMLAIGLELLLGESYTGADVVNLLHRALTGVEARPALIEEYGGRIDRAEMTAVELALIAAETDLNSSNLDLVGLSSGGLAYSLASF